MTQLQTLFRVGFRRVGRWNLTSEKACFSLEDSGDQADVLYAFVSDEQVLYIGKTTKGLKKRMYGYQQPGPTQRTNIACNGQLMKLLMEERSVDIYVFADSEPRVHAGIPLNLAAALEDGLIAAVRPPWNRLGL